MHVRIKPIHRDSLAIDDLIEALIELARQLASEKPAQEQQVQASEGKQSA